jgi:DNA-binding transcriptional regulator YiaG
MNNQKKKHLERAGWAVGGATDFLELTPEEAKFIEVKLALAAGLKELREKRDLTQTVLATRLGSSQSRVAKMEAADPSVSLDLLIKSLFTIGATAADIAKWIKRAETKRAA